MFIKSFAEYIYLKFSQRCIYFSQFYFGFYFDWYQDLIDKHFS